MFSKFYPSVHGSPSGQGWDPTPTPHKSGYGTPTSPPPPPQKGTGRKDQRKDQFRNPPLPVGIGVGGCGRYCLEMLMGGCLVFNSSTSWRHFVTKLLNQMQDVKIHVEAGSEKKLILLGVILVINAIEPPAMHLSSIKLADYVAD